MEYAGLRRRISDAEKGASKARTADRREEAVESLRRLKPGDVIMVPTGKFAGLGRGHRPRLVARGAAAVRRDRPTARPAGSR